MAKEIPSELVEEVSLYVSEKKVYPREQGGRFQFLRKAAVISAARASTRAAMALAEIISSII